ncbi:DUF2969 domain-containing protein [Oenococcus oeni]|uniref:DUF2969 domain-containing protein n=6 Tax=Oenococcus oeni TaxID=1247 RepID=Q04G16_OENOB|nr:DUF2969 domain-containing protein [Oenococcus oeni]EAV39713.1 hypothetical protein OENOO_48005 [Oenococcus oeni ATCC BAA-1163]KGO16602.1 hypothetical protein OA32_03250 [Oenococcus oeni X2L]ABJ56606.1 hypothetical protein OEOE_0669 [Oenococcus oeni PSU-1]AVI93866.1 hypothetical protein AX764_02995 [Oenococcus oeni]AWW98235.1 DUF2969 domain-containing protein [Oenococcus oeni]
MSNREKNYQVELVEDGAIINVLIAGKTIGNVTLQNDLYSAKNSWDNFLGDFKKQDQAVMAVISNFNLRQA